MREGPERQLENRLAAPARAVAERADAPGGDAPLHGLHEPHATPRTRSLRTKAHHDPFATGRAHGHTDRT